MPRIAPYLQSSAKRLRRDQTDAELKLWMRLQDRQINGLKFRRQHAIGPYLVDFCCLEKKLVIEIDGGQHLEQEESDQRRTDYLARRGYRALRYWNHDVLNATDVVLEDIFNSVERPHLQSSLHPHPHPLPGRERGYENTKRERGYENTKRERGYENTKRERGYENKKRERGSEGENST